jgi:MFS family permease
MRFLLGFTQAFCVVYSPVWVNEFSPRKSSTRWLAILHSFAVVGVMVGYVFGAIIINFFAKSLGWRFAFMIQGWFMLFIGAGFLFSDNSALDIFKENKDKLRPASISEIR